MEEQAFQLGVGPLIEPETSDQQPDMGEQDAEGMHRHKPRSLLPLTMR